jgi:hypothetical protein
VVSSFVADVEALRGGRPAWQGGCDRGLQDADAHHVTDLAGRTKRRVDPGQPQEQLLPRLPVGRIAFRVGLCAQQGAAPGDAVSSDRVGQQAVVADPHEAFWHHVSKETPEEVDGVEGKELALVAIGAVPVPEREAATIEGDQAMIGKGDAVGVGGVLITGRTTGQAPVDGASRSPTGWAWRSG